MCVCSYTCVGREGGEGGHKRNIPWPGDLAAVNELSWCLRIPLWSSDGRGCVFASSSMYRVLSVSARHTLLFECVLCVLCECQAHSAV